MALYNPNIGRRTGVDVKAGKNIRILENGFENFSDYWTDESETEDTYEQIFAEKEKENEAVKSTKQTRHKVKVRSMSPFSSVDRSVNSLKEKVALTRISCKKSIGECSQSKCTATVDKSNLEPATKDSIHVQEEIGAKEATVNEEKDREPTISTLSGRRSSDDKSTEREEDIETNNPNSADERIRNVQNQQIPGGETAEEECDLNTAGEINGTITRGEQVLEFKKAQISSAVQSFKTRKRLTYGTSLELSPNDEPKDCNLQPKATTSEFKVPFPKSKTKSPQKSETKRKSKNISNDLVDLPKNGKSGEINERNTSVESSPRNTVRDTDGALSKSTFTDKASVQTNDSSCQLELGDVTGETDSVDESLSNKSIDVKSSNKSKKVDVLEKRASTTGNLLKNLDSKELGEVDIDIVPSEGNKLLVSDEIVFNDRTGNKSLKKSKPVVPQEKRTSTTGSLFENLDSPEQVEVDKDNAPNEKKEVLVSDSDYDENEDSCAFATLSQKQTVKKSPQKRKSSVDLELKLLRKQEVQTLRAVKTAGVQQVMDKKKKTSRGKDSATVSKSSESGSDAAPSPRKRQSSAREGAAALPPLPTKPGRKKQKKDTVPAIVEKAVSVKSCLSDQRNDNALVLQNKEIQVDNNQPENVEIQEELYLDEYIEMPVRVTRSKGGKEKVLTENTCSGFDKTSHASKKGKALKPKVSHKQKKGKIKTKQSKKQTRKGDTETSQVESEEGIALPVEDNDIVENNDMCETEKPDLQPQQRKTLNKKPTEPKEIAVESVDTEDSETKTDKQIPVGYDDVNAESGVAEQIVEHEVQDEIINNQDSHNEEVLNTERDENKKLSPVSHRRRTTEMEDKSPFHNASSVAGNPDEVESEDDFEVVEEKISMRRLSVAEAGTRRTKSSKGSTSQEDEPEKTGKLNLSGNNIDMRSDGNSSKDLKLSEEKSQISEDDAADTNKLQTKSRKNNVKKRKSKVVKKTRSTKISDDKDTENDPADEEIAADQLTSHQKRNANKKQVKRGKNAKKKGGKVVENKASYIDTQPYRDTNINAQTTSQSDSEGANGKKTGKQPVQKKRQTKGKQKQPVSSDANTGTDSDVNAQKTNKNTMDKSKGNKTEPQVLDDLSHVLGQLEFNKNTTGKKPELNGRHAPKNRPVKTNVINSTRVMLPNDGCENYEDYSCLMPSPNLSPIKRVLTKPRNARTERSLVNLTRRSQFSNTPTTITKRKKRKHVGEDSSEGGTDNNSSGSVLNNPGGSMSPPPAPNTDAVADQKNLNESGGESHVEADDEMVSPPDTKKAKKMTPVRHKGKKKIRTSSASGENTTPPRHNKLKSRKVHLNMTPLPPTPSTTPGKRIKSILKNSNVRSRISLKQRSPPIEAEVTPSTIRSSGKRKSAPESDANSPMHIYEVTESQTPKPVRITPPVKKQVKIIVPEVPEDSSLRRSQRTRVPCLDWFKNERIEYERRKSGGFVIKGVTVPENIESTSTEQGSTKQKPKGVRQRRKKTGPQATPRNLSMHTDPPDDYEDVDSTEIPVMDPDTGDDVLIECVKTSEDYEFVTPAGKDPTEMDPLILTKIMKQRAFSVGMLVLRPFEEKETQFVRKDTIVFLVKYGKLAVTIHRTTVILETDSTFFVPQGNTYSIKNLRCEDAKLWFFRHIGEKAITPSSNRKETASQNRT